MYLYVLFFFDFYRTAKVNIFKYLGKDYLQKFFFKGGRKFGYLQK
jgi:hypothetical protein